MKTRGVSVLVAAVLAGAATTRGGDGAGYRRTVARYEVPDVGLVNQDGARVRLPQVLAADKPIVMAFIFTTCTTVCPVLSVGFATLEKALGAQARDVRLVSIAIDPDHDTPEVLRAYRDRFEAGTQWELLTGPHDDIVRVRKAFDAYGPNKTTHRPLIFLRPPGDDSWVRIDGLIGAEDLMTEYRGLARP